MFLNKIKSCRCWNVGGRNGFALNSNCVGVWIVLLPEWSLGEFKLKLCSVGVPVLLGVSEVPASIGPIMLDSISVEPYETGVESCVGNDSENDVVLLRVLFFPGGLAVRYMDFRFRDNHQFLAELVYLLNL